MRYDYCYTAAEPVNDFTRKKTDDGYVLYRTFANAEK